MHVVKDWGKEVWLVNTELYCCKRMYLRKGWQCSLHYHKIKDETFIVVSGQVKFELDGEVRMLYPQDTVRVKPGMKHRFGGIQDSEMLEISTTHSDEDVYREEASRRMI